MTKDELQGLRGQMGAITDNLLKEQVLKAKEQALEVLNLIAQQQAYQNLVTGEKTEQPSYAGGKISAWNNIIPSAIGSLASMYQYFDADRQDIKSPDVYAGNPYASAALQDLASIKINPYASMRKMYNAERRNRYALEHTGGLTGGQKYFANVASGIGTQKNIGDMLNNIQALNNQYKANYASSRLQAGEAIAQRRLTANQFNEEMTARAHAAKLQQKQMGMRNFMDYLNNFAANEYKRKTGNEMLDLYRQQNELEENKLLYLMKLAGQLPENTSPVTRTNIYVPQTSIPEYRFSANNSPFKQGPLFDYRINMTEPLYIPFGGTKIKYMRNYNYGVRV